MQKNTSNVQAMVWSFYDLMRQQGVSTDQYDQIMLKMMAIYALSIKDELPNGIEFTKDLADYKGEWLALVEALKVSEDSQVRAVFSSDDILEKLPTPLVHGLITTLLAYPAESVGSLAVDVMSLMTLNSSLSKPNNYAHMSVYQLVNKILGNKQNQSLYGNSEQALPICVEASQKSGAVYYEAINPLGMIADALSLMSPHRFTTSYTDYLKRPGYTSFENELRQFDCGASFPPMGMKVPRNAYDDKSTFDRFGLKTMRMEVLNILHLIKQCRDTVVTSVSESILFSTTEKEFRQYLVDNGMLKAVISLPSDIWAGTSVKTSLVVIEPEGNNKSVRFLDITKTDFIEKTTKRLVGLTDLDKILSCLNSEEELDCAISTSQQEIQKKEYSLDAGKYVLDFKEKKLRNILKESETVVLDKIARFERGLPFKPEEGDCTILEVTVNDLNDIVDITTPTKEVKISSSEHAKNKAGFLQPNDIVLVLQGSAGKLGLVPENVPTTDDESWMVNKSAIVIRVTSDIIDPRALYAYLASDIGQTQLSSIAQGAVIANISLKELRNLPIIVPSLEEQRKAIALIDNSRSTQKTIQKLLAELDAQKNDLWNL